MEEGSPAQGRREPIGGAYRRSGAPALTYGRSTARHLNRVYIVCTQSMFPMLTLERQPRCLNFEINWLLPS